jgi:DNA repair exonuclease SbcCD ATPase subunit
VRILEKLPNLDPTKLPNLDDILDSASSHLLNNVGTDNISSNSRGSNLARLAILGFDTLGNLLTNEQYKRQQQALINQMNEYNTPANQMQRYKDAGLNPNLMAGQISAGNQSSAGEPHAMQLHPIDALTAVSNVNLQAAQADEIRERAIAQRNANSLFAYDSVLKALSIDELKSRINKQIKDLEMMDSQKKLNEAQTQTLNDLRQTEKELKKAQTKLAQIQEEYTPKNAASRLGKGFSDLWDITWSIMNLFWTGAGTNDKAPVPNPDVLSRKYIYKYD